MKLGLGEHSCYLSLTDFVGDAAGGGEAGGVCTAEHDNADEVLLCNEFRENVAAWVCFYDRKDIFKGFLERVLRLKEGIELSIAEKTNYLVFMINAFQSLGDEVVSETVLRLASLQSWHSLSYGRFQV
nr:intron-binding protein aquarius [Quercus suber]